MKRLFFMECKKITRSVLYWLYVAALVMTVVQNYDAAVESELRQTDDPVSVFYIAEDGVYADAADSLNGETQNTMMLGATKRLMDNYRNNSYEYYPFGYVKKKKLSEKEQETVLLYLKELTGLSESAINGTDEEQNAGRIEDSKVKNTQNSDTGDALKNEEEELQISGGGAFILRPGQGGSYENGQFVVEPEDWEYVENSSGISEPSESSENPEESKEPEEPQRQENSKEVQVTLERFREIMDCVNDLIGRNSYFSWTMLSMYYCENDMQSTPITEQQHQEFYEKDRVTGAFARYFCDSISLVMLCLPAFVIIDLLLKDKRCKMRTLIYPRTESSGKIIFARFLAAVCMIMLPVLILPVKSLITLVLYCQGIGVDASIFAFMVYIFAWIFPTVLLVVSVALFVTVLTENYSAVLVTGLIWLFGRPALDKIAGGNYGLFDLVIRHNTLKGYGRMMDNIQMLILNRVIVSAVALLFAGLAVMVYDAKRKGGITFEGRKFVDHYRRKHSHEL